MRPLLQHASRAISANAAPIVRQSTVRSFTSFVKKQPSVCVQCQFRASVVRSAFNSSRLPRRYFHQTPNDDRKPFDEKKTPTELPGEPSLETQIPPDANEPILIEPTARPNEENIDPSSPPADGEGIEEKPKVTPKKEGVVDNIDRVPAEKLPSHMESQRWNFHKRLNELMDELLPKLADVTQKVNTYTGTDYTGIQALKQEIKDQEKLVKARRGVIEEAKQALDAAHSQAAASQKEVVALLERKHSWSATDLERYMSLIRSEHVNDQAVREAKEAITAAENALEEARSQLEKRERAQYHEEQIWSDTIRRNSTWVTFGLMGLNILLLLLSLLIFEPWRRRRMVREIKAALEAHKTSMEPIMNPSLQAAAPVAAIEAKVVEAVQPAESVAASPEPVTPITPPASPDAASPVPEKLETAVEEPSVSPADPLPPVLEPTIPEAVPLTPAGVSPQETIDIEQEVKEEAQLPTVQGTWQDKVKFIAKDIISEREISMRRLDFTNYIISSAAAGAIIAAAVVGLFTSR